MRLSRLLLLPALLVALAAAPAGAATRYVNTKTFTLGPGKTRTFEVAVPHPHAFSNGKTSFRFSLLPPATLRQGQTQPDLRKVRLLRSGYLKKGTVVYVRVRNGNRAGTAPVRVRVRVVNQRR